MARFHNVVNLYRASNKEGGLASNSRVLSEGGLASNSSVLSGEKRGPVSNSTELMSDWAWCPTEGAWSQTEECCKRGPGVTNSRALFGGGEGWCQTVGW